MQLYISLYYRVGAPALPCSLSLNAVPVHVYRSLIKYQVRSAMGKNESKLKGLVGTIERLDRGIDYENSIQLNLQLHKSQWLLLPRRGLKHPSICPMSSSHYYVLFLTFVSVGENDQT